MRALCLLLFSCACSSSGTPLEQAFEAAGQVPNVASLRVEQHGVLVRERYFRGDANTPHDVRSVTKSITSMLVGIANQQGCLNLRDTLGETLGAEAPPDPAKAAITVRDLLTMSSGFQWDELGDIAEYNKWVLSVDPAQYVLALPLADAPGTFFSYSSPSFHLLSLALSNRCGEAAGFAQARLFDPLGIAQPAWETFAAPLGVNGAAGLQLSTVDLAKIGELVLHGGGLNGVQLVPADYLTDATSVQIANGDATDFGPGYGYGFWLAGHRTEHFILAQGYGGQFIFVEPEKELVVVATSDWQGHSDTASQTFDSLYAVIAGQVIPSLQ
jgi:CubicO group peptidase (beta-lactamase class C family)